MSEGPSERPDVLHAPWRLSYMDMLAQTEKAKDGPGCAAPGGEVQRASTFLREAWLTPEEDEARLVVVRTGRDEMRDGDGRARGGLIMLNRYPYANGHLLVCLGDARMRLLDYTEGQRAELWSLVDLAVSLCERTLEPQGVNVGVNQGRAAGAGVPEHLHVHVVPRWSGDVNFITACGQIRVLPCALEDMLRRYREEWGRMGGSR